MIKCQFLLFLLIKGSISSPFREVASVLDDIQDAVLKNNELDSINQPLINLHNSDPDVTAICWAESHIITENKRTKEKTISKAYSVLIDSPGNLVGSPEENQNVSCFEVLDQNKKPKKMLNFTTVKENDNYVIREHKTLFCGAGPVLSQHYVVWPKLKRKQIEISINPLVQHVLKNCSDIEEDNLLGIIDEDSIFDDRNIEDITEEPFDKEDNTTKSIGAMYGNGELTRSIPDEIIGGGDQNDVIDVLEPAKDGNNTELPEKPIGNKIKKSLLARNFNCTLDGLGTCKEIRDKSRALIGTSNSTKISLGKWFFPDSVLAGPVDENRSFVLKVQILVNIKKQNNNSSIKYTEDENSTVFIVEEECLVVVQNENKTKRSSLQTGYNKESNPKKN